MKYKSLKKAMEAGILSLSLGLSSFACAPKTYDMGTEWEATKTYEETVPLKSDKNYQTNKHIEDIKLSSDLEFKVLEDKYSNISGKYMVKTKQDYEEVNVTKTVEYEMDSDDAITLGNIGFWGGILLTSYLTQGDNTATWAGAIVCTAFGLLVATEKKETLEKEPTGETKTEVIDERVEYGNNKTNLIYKNKPVEADVNVSSNYFLINGKTSAIVHSNSDGIATADVSFPNNFYLESPYEAELIRELKGKKPDFVLEDIIKNNEDISRNIVLEVDDKKTVFNVEGKVINCNHIELENIACGTH